MRSKRSAKEVVSFPGMSRSEITDLAQRGHLPLREPVKRTDAVQVLAETMLADARAAGDNDFTREEAFSKAFTRINNAKTAAGAK